MDLGGTLSSLAWIDEVLPEATFGVATSRMPTLVPRFCRRSDFSSSVARTNANWEPAAARWVYRTHMLDHERCFLGPMTILEVARNVWKTAPATRAAVLIDGADYYLALRQAFLKAERSIRILGWDIDSRTKLVGPTGSANDGLPEELGKFLSALCKRRPELHIDLLLWDYSLVYAMEREPLPLVAFQWQTAPGGRAFARHEAERAQNHQDDESNKNR